MLRHADPFSHYAAGQHLRVYPSSGTATGTPGTFATGPYGRGAGAGFRLSGNFSDFLQRDAIGAVGAIGIYEVDFRVSAAPAQDNVVLAFLDGGALQCSLVLTTGLQLAVYRGGFVGGTLLGTLGYTLTLDRFVHLSWKALIGNSGSVTLQAWADSDVTAGATLSLTGVDTQTTGAAQWDGLHLGAACNGNTDWANLIVLDGSGGVMNDLLGPCDVTALRASSRRSAAVAEWPLSAGADAVALIRDGVPDDDLTYLYASAPGPRHLSYVDAVPFPDREILGWQLYACARKTDSHTPTVSPIIRDGGTDYTAAAQSPALAEAYVMQPYSRMPSGSVLSAAAFDALQHGLEKTS